MKVHVEYLGAVQFEVKTRGHTIVSDQPEAEGGFDEGMTPPELLLASLGTCAGYYAAEYLKARKLDTTGLSVDVVAEKAKSPSRLGAFRIDVRVPQGLAERHRDGVEKAVQSCLIHNTLLHPPSLDLRIIDPSQSGKVAA